MEEQMKELLNKGKEDPYYMEKVIETFSPLIKAYGRKTGWKIESEDMESLLTIRLIELVKTMNVYDSDGQNVKYISTAIKYHFLNILQKINKIKDREIQDLSKFENKGCEDKTEAGFDSIIANMDEKRRKY